MPALDLLGDLDGHAADTARAPVDQRSGAPGEGEVLQALQGIFLIQALTYLMWVTVVAVEFRAVQRDFKFHAMK